MQHRSPNETAVIYHYYNPRKVTAWKDLKYPVVLSISSLRDFDKQVKIYVVDVSESSQDWGDLEHDLNFKVIRKNRKRFQTSTASQVGREESYAMILLSGVFDMHEVAMDVPEKNIICSDTDIFWVREPFPLLKENNMHKVCMNGNTGLYYYAKGSPEVDRFFELWKGLILSSLEDPLLKREVESYSSARILHDETTARYLQKHYPNDYCEISNLENFGLYHRSWKRYLSEEVKAIHLMFGRWGGQRGYACKAFNDIPSALSEDKFKEIMPLRIEPVWIRDLTISPEVHFERIMRPKIF